LARIAYQKPYLSSEALCQKLIYQGLAIDNQDIANRVFEQCSYYRFKAYLFPFKELTTKKYKPNANFTKGYELYNFDSELRTYLFKIIEKVEIGVRSALDQWITNQTNNPFWYLDSALFNNNGKQIQTVTQIRSMFVDSKEEFAQHYRNKYFNEFCPFYRDLPPAWVALELMTFGNVVNLMNSLNENAIQTLKLNRFSKKKLGVDKYKTVCNWVEAIRQVRNACGHHNRLFNRNLMAPTGIKRYLESSITLVRTRPAPDKREEDQMNRLYTNICAIQVLYSGLKHEDKIGVKIAEFFQDNPTSLYFLDSMGFPSRWQEEPLLFNL